MTGSHAQAPASSIILPLPVAHLCVPLFTLTKSSKSGIIESLMTLDRNHQQRPSRAWFATTHWSVVLAAGDKADSGSAESLQTLCQTYWYPLYAYVRQKGYGSQDAEDLTQSFFMHLLDKDRLGRLARDRGKFRSFLLTALNHFLVDQWKRASAQKRGGDHQIFR